jgi:small-conductance mechanosensitive channel
MNDFVVFGASIPAVVYIPVLYLFWAAFFLLLKKLFYRKIQDLAKVTTSDIDDIFLDALNRPLVFIILASGLYVLNGIFGFGLEGKILKSVDVFFKVAVITSILVFLDKFIKGIIKSHSKDITVLKSSESVILIVVRALVAGVGVLIILDSLGISITPILASLGIGSLAVALALQPTLENLFSGIQLIADKPIELGHFIKLESGEEGYVERIGWRSTWIRMLPNNMVIIPNKVLVSSRVVNYYHPDTELAVLVQVGVHYDSDLELVEKVTIAAAEDIMKTVQGGVPDFKPFIRFHTFGESSINFTVIMRGKEFVDTHIIKHEFVKKLRAAYAKEGIIIPYPIRTLDWNQGSGPIKISKEQ